MSMIVEDVAALYAGWPVERLVRAAYLDFDDYAPDAVQIMRRVLAERGVSTPEVEAIVSDLRARGVNDPLNRIRGWLLFFVIHVALVTMADFLNAALLLVGAGSWPQVAVGLISAGVAVYGAYCSRLLTAHRPEAPGHARRLMMVWAGGAIAQTVFWSLDSGEALRGGGGPLLFAILWYPYLLNSKRVATVYAVRDHGRLPRSGKTG